MGDKIGTVSDVRSGRGSSVGHGGEMFDRPEFIVASISACTVSTV